MVTPVRAIRLNEQRPISNRGKRFPVLRCVHTGSYAHVALVQWLPGSPPPADKEIGVKPNIHIHRVLRLQIGRAIPPLILVRRAQYNLAWKVGRCCRMTRPAE
jgi:hypothetical protein